MLTASLMLGTASMAYARAVDLPEGPIHDRHELMEGIGKDAKAIGGAAKSGDAAVAAAAGKRIAEAAKKIPALFPKDSTHPNSRAKPQIWENWERFVELSEELEAAATAVVTAADAGGPIGATTGPLFQTCKGCHDSFRVPDED
jgi:cytochrome c556